MIDRGVLPTTNLVDHALRIRWLPNGTVTSVAICQVITAMDNLQTLDNRVTPKPRLIGHLTPRETRNSFAMAALLALRFLGSQRRLAIFQRVVLNGKREGPR
ncbi:hypothetical protein APR50_33850 [Variovorax paradoxus]|nr:hypothetical protein APR49_42615 [Variovorax paradoxus]KPU98772.1 hypothetical protein APR50_33850 [Variovorax paradoxus]KPV26393.1 hypothetical protein APR48_31355 [Variovorax paradoxus]KPV27690.1 hypothetical protein APR47_30555 [Variovorax paradoxus]